MTKAIQHLLADICHRESIDILYACESGSRAWGFASSDSDYDIRFLYRRPIKDSYQIHDLPDTIEIPIKDDLDPGGWDLRKALQLLHKSNGALIEWLHSPIIYQKKETFHEELKILAHSSLDRKNLANHYRGMAKRVLNIDLATSEPTGKAYLYALRATLAGLHVLIHGTPPPVEFAKLLSLLPKTERKAVDQLLTWKTTATEKATPGRLPVIDLYLSQQAEFQAQACHDLPSTPTDPAPFNTLLHRWTLWP